MQRAIVGFDQDELGDWRAILACGHRQHGRHNPPLIARPWVLTAEGRRQFLGAVLECKACDEGEPVSDAMLSPDALEAIYAQFEADLMRFIHSRAAEPGTIDDMLRNVYLAIHAHAGDQGRSDRLASWLDWIVRQAISDLAHRDRPPAGLPDGDDREAAAELIPAVKGMLACLPGTYRQALLMAEERGLTPDEIADRLDIPLAAAESRVARGRAILREALLDWCHFAAESNGGTLPYRPDCPGCVA